MSDDAQLLRQYVETRSQPAFTALVERHLPLVYHSALRQLGPHQHLADDIAQSVFVLLADKSPALLDHPSLAGWLHTATHFKVARAVRAERRRECRELGAVAMTDLPQEASREEWEQIRPVLDLVLLELNARDREAVLLRFFENCAFPDVAARLHLTESAARKCVERALEKLRVRLTRRGVASSTAALVTLLGSQGALAAPTGLATSVAGAVVTSGLPVAAVTTGVTLMSTKTTLGFAAVALILAGGVGTYEVRAHRAAVETLAAVEGEADAALAKMRAAQERMARAQASTPTVEETQAAAKATATATVGPAAPRSSIEERAVEGRAFLKAHPEVEAALVTSHKATLRQRYADLISAMGLSEAESERFIAVIMNGSMQIVGEHMFRLTDEQLSSSEYTRQLKEVLGPDRFQQYRAFEQTNAARGLANDLTRSLYYTPTPLAPTQLAQFKQVVVAALEDRSLGPRYTSVWEWMPLPVWDAVLQRAGGVLAPAQLEALVDLHQQAIFHQAETEARAAYDKKK